MKYLSSTALVLIASVSAAQSSTCTPGSVVDGTTVTCSGGGIFAPGVVAPTANNVTVEITGGAGVGTNDPADPGGQAIIELGDGASITQSSGTILKSTGPDAATIEVGNDLTLSNAGMVTTAGNDSRAVDGGEGANIVNTGSFTTSGEDSDVINVDDGAYVWNRGTIQSNGKGSDGIQVGKKSTVINNATIFAAKDGINADDDATVTNSATIRAGSDGIQVGDGGNHAPGAGANVTNSGNIYAGKEGITGGDDLVIVNSGNIYATDDAVQIGERVHLTNSGLIENTAVAGQEPQDGLDLDSGVVINSGIIRSTIDAGIDFDGSTTDSSVTNSGLITGTTGILVEKDVTEGANLAAQTIQNSGTIEGTAGIAMDLGAGNDSYVHLTGGVLLGGADFGTGEDSFFLTGTPVGTLGGDPLALFDGGLDNDLFDFGGYAFTDLVSVALSGAVYSLELLASGATDSLFLNLTSWEAFRFSDGDFTQADLAALTTPAVPLPAGLVLMLSGLAGFGAMRRARR